jgi:hypothetical protein
MFWVGLALGMLIGWVAGYFIISIWIARQLYPRK